MKKLLLFISLFPLFVFGQVPQTQPEIRTSTGTLSIGSGSVAATSSLLDITSTTKGFLPPRMTTTQRDAISSPATGLQIYNTTTSAINYYNGSAWVAAGTGAGTVTSVAASVPSLFSISGSPITTSGTLAMTYSGTALPVANGGTNATSASIAAFNNITGYSAAGATGTISTNLVFNTSPTLITPILGTPTSGTLTNCTGLPEGGLSLTDITTANVSNSAHGFFPKLTANSVYYVNNSGALTALTVGAAGTVLTGNGVTSAPTWAASSSGITINSTAITGNTANALLFGDASNVVQQNAKDFYFQTASTFNHVFASGRTGTITGVSNSAFGYQALKSNTSGARNTAIGQGAGLSSVSSSDNTFIGYNAGTAHTAGYTSVAIGSGAADGCSLYSATVVGADAMGGASYAVYCVAVGYQALYSNTDGSYGRSTAIGYSAMINSTNRDNTGVGATVFPNLTSGTYNNGIGGNAGTGLTTGSFNTALGISSTFIAASASSIAIGYLAISTASNQCVIGGDDGSGGGNIYDVYIGSGVTKATPNAVTINATGGSASVGANLSIKSGPAAGTNLAGSNLTMIPGAATGTNATGGDFIVQSCITVAASGTTVQTPASTFIVKKSGSIEIPTKVIDVTSGDAATINSVAGRFKKDASGSTFTLTNSLVTANSIIILSMASDPGVTGFDMFKVAGAGSFVVTFTTSGVAAAPTNVTDVDFIVIN